MRLRYAVPAAVAGLMAAACTDGVTPTGVTPDGSTPSLAVAHTPVTGAAFTTVNENVDDAGHCKNGSPNVNCNIYDGKEFVWLNGGPSTAYVGDGEYFFAVLVPGGQPNPNDGGAKNLSDDYDAYGDRTFSVTGGTVDYSGPHDFDSNKIRLMSYAPAASFTIVGASDSTTEPAWILNASYLHLLGVTG